MPENRTIPIVCKQCGETFLVPTYQASRARFCSKACYWAFGRGPLAPRFWKNVAIGAPDECWEWQAARDRRNYGVIYAHGHLERTHRVAYELTNGPIPDGKDVLHSCDNPPCCNPAHLRPGTKKENAQDMVSRNRHAAATKPDRVCRGERNGRAILTEANVRAIRKRALDGEGVADLSRSFAVAEGTIRNVVKGRTWPNVTP